MVTSSCPAWAPHEVCPQRPLMANFQAPLSSPSFWPGRLPVAFMLSAPGTCEAAKGFPVAGGTGDNLSVGLEFLHAARPDLFPSSNRYDYRIANAYSKPLSLALGSGRTEASDREILESGNIARVMADLNGCHLVVLCGIKAQLLTAAIERQLGCRSLSCYHTSSRGIMRLPVNAEAAAIPDQRVSPATRGRMWSWAHCLMTQIDNAQ
jgi:hypothetical protein